LKKGQINTAWKKRYFILKNDTLFYFKDADDMFHPQGVIYVNGATIDGDPKNEKSSNVFIIKSSNGKDKVHVLQAESLDEKKQWISAILEKSKGLNSAKREEELKIIQKQVKEEGEKKALLDQNVKALTNPLNI